MQGMEEFIVLNQKPNIVYAYPKFISKWGANYFSVNRINMIKKIKKSNIEYDLLSNRVEIQNIRRIPKEKSSELYIGLADVNTQTGELTENNTINEGITGISNAVRKGQILFSKLRPNLNKVTICPQSINEALASTEFCIFEARNIDKYYLFAVLKSNVGLFQVIDITTGSTLPRLDTEDILNILIPIPSPEIQKYIGDKVRKAEELREEAKRLKKEAEGIIYKELNFGSLEDKLKIINNKYTWVGLHNLGIRIDSKYYNEKVLRIKDYFNKHYETIKLKECLQYCSRGKSFAESSEDGIILIKTKNLNNSFINYERNFVYEKEVNNNLILKEKDLIFASMGVGSLGKIDMYYPSEEKATIDGTLMLLRFKSDSKLKPEYVMEFLRTHIGQKLIYQNVVGSTGIISISVDDLINIDIPYIDDEKQEKISNFTNKYLTDIYASKRLIQEAKQDV